MIDRYATLDAAGKSNQSKSLYIRRSRRSAYVPLDISILMLGSSKAVPRAATDTRVHGRFCIVPVQHRITRKTRDNLQDVLQNRKIFSIFLQFNHLPKINSFPELPDGSRYLPRARSLARPPYRPPIAHEPACRP